MELTKTERLILANQYEILGELKSSDYYRELSQNLKLGFLDLYSNIFKEIEPVFMDDSAEFVYDTLALYTLLKDSYEGLSNDDKQQVKEAKVVFTGFDAYTESRYLSFILALRRSGRFIGILSDTNLDSHTPNAANYRQMIHVWRTMSKPAFPLSAEQIKAITD